MNLCRTEDVIILEVVIILEAVIILEIVVVEGITDTIIVDITTVDLAVDVVVDLVSHQSGYYYYSEAAGNFSWPKGL